MSTQRRSRRSGRPARSNLSARTPPDSEFDDPNLRAAALLYDMASLQGTDRSQLGYKRAAKAVLELAAPVAELVAANALREVPFIGPSSARIVSEFVHEGRSATVEAAIAGSAKAPEVTKRAELRRDFLSRHAMERALALRLPAAIVNPRVFRGDFQMHSTWSDGAESIGTMAEACRALGHTCMGITDHSYGLPVARGISMSAALGQQQEIDRLNEQYEGRFRIFKGIEANILADGTVDLEFHERPVFEYVIASPHSLLRRTDDQTARMVAAVGSPGVAILGHPRGRMFDRRAGVTADWRQVFDAAAERGVAIELDGNWHRQDLDWRLAALALDAGCIFALDSDAHSTAELRFTHYALAHARLARIPATRVINCWSNERLEDWMRQRHDT